MNINESWKTDRLLIRKAKTDDIKALNQVCASWEDKILLEGEGFPDEYVEDCINNGDLPPIKDASIENYYFLTIQSTDGDTIGFLDIYHGYPDSDTIWIGMFVIDKTYREHSYGKEVIESLIEKSKQADWKTIGIGVHLKNWRGLRFWNKNGFNKIIGIYGDKDYSESSYSIIGLRNELHTQK